MDEKEIKIAGPLVEADVIDLQGHFFPSGVLKKAVEKFNASGRTLPITDGFRNDKPPVGRVDRLYFGGHAVSVQGTLLRDAENLSDKFVQKDLELALGGKIIEKHESDLNGRKFEIIDDMEITEVALVKDKCK